MHKNYNSRLHILDMHLERGETSVSTDIKTNSSFLFGFYDGDAAYFIFMLRNHSCNKLPEADSPVKHTANKSVRKE